MDLNCRLGVHFVSGQLNNILSPGGMKGGFRRDVQGGFRMNVHCERPESESET
jgi:hypothetical protein